MGRQDRVRTALNGYGVIGRRVADAAALQQTSVESRARRSHPLLTHDFSLGEITEAYRVFGERLDGVFESGDSTLEKAAANAPPRAPLPAPPADQPRAEPSTARRGGATVPALVRPNPLQDRSARGGVVRQHLSLPGFQLTVLHRGYDLTPSKGTRLPCARPLRPSRKLPRVSVYRQGLCVSRQPPSGKKREREILRLRQTPDKHLCGTAVAEHICFSERMAVALARIASGGNGRHRTLPRVTGGRCLSAWGQVKCVIDCRAERYQYVYCGPLKSDEYPWGVRCTSRFGPCRSCRP